MKITGDGYPGIPSFKVSLWLNNQGDETLILGRLYYELFVVPGREFLGSGEAFVKGNGDNPTTVLYLDPHGEMTGVASTFELDERKIGIVDKARADKDATFQANIYGDARVCQVDGDGHEKTIYVKLSGTCEATVPREEWVRWVDSWMNNQRILLVNKQTFQKLNDALLKRDGLGYDDVIQELFSAKEAEPKGQTEANALENATKSSK